MKGALYPGTTSGSGGTGTVTSVGLTAPAEIAVAGSPVTTAGTLALTWASAAQNAVFAGPFGSAGTPAFRVLVAGDIPSLDAAKIATGTLATARLGTGGTANTVLHGNQVFSAVSLSADVTGSLALSSIATIADQTLLGNVSGSTAAPIALTKAQTLTFLGTIGVANGGIGQTTFTKGDLLVAPGGASLNKLGVGTDGFVFTADAASTNGVKWAAAAGGISGLTSGRVTLSTGATTIGDDAAFLFSSASSVGTLTLGNAANGIVKGGAKLILQTTSNANIELTPNGTGNVDVTAGQLLIGVGTTSNPGIAFRGDVDSGFYQSTSNEVRCISGGLLQWYCDQSFAMFVNSNRLRPLSNDTVQLGDTDTRWKDIYGRHVTANVRTVTGNTTFDRTYQIIIVNAAGATTQTLPSAVTALTSCGNSDVYTIKNRGAGTVTVAATAGTVEVTTITTGQAYTYYSDGTNWYVR